MIKPPEQPLPSLTSSVEGTGYQGVNSARRQSQTRGCFALL